MDEYIRFLSRGLILPTLSDQALGFHRCFSGTVINIAPTILDFPFHPAMWLVSLATVHVRSQVVRLPQLSYWIGCKRTVRLQLSEEFGSLPRTSA